MWCSDKRASRRRYIEVVTFNFVVYFFSEISHSVWNKTAENMEATNKIRYLSTISFNFVYHIILQGSVETNSASTSLCNHRVQEASGFNDR